jgi:ornithine--oxo-acid transaminase
MIDNAAAEGGYFLDELRNLLSNQVKEVRGCGLMIAVEFYEDSGGARQYSEAFQRAGLLCKETHENTLRFAPPLIIARDQVDWILETARTVFRNA